MATPDLNPVTGRPYRLRSLRKRLAAAARDRTDAVFSAHLERAEARKAAARKAREEKRRATPARSGPRVAPSGPDQDRKPRDRTLRGKDRVRARKAARREAGRG